MIPTDRQRLWNDGEMMALVLDDPRPWEKPQNNRGLCAGCAKGKHTRKHSRIGCVVELANGYICDCLEPGGYWR